MCVCLNADTIIRYFLRFYHIRYVLRNLHNETELGWGQSHKRKPIQNDNWKFSTLEKGQTQVSVRGSPETKNVTFSPWSVICTHAATISYDEKIRNFAINAVMCFPDSSVQNSERLEFSNDKQIQGIINSPRHFPLVRSVWVTSWHSARVPPGTDYRYFLR